jgi:hypothetical protein
LTRSKGFNLRILGVSGTCIVSGALLEDTTVTSGIITSTWSRGGLDLDGQANTIPQANLTTLLSVTHPDVVLMSFQDYTQGTVGLPAAWTLWSTARSAQSWCVLAPHLDQSLGSNRTRNDEIAAWCKSTGNDYADATSVVKDYATAVALGWMADTAHLNSQGFQAVATMFWRSMDILNEVGATGSQNVSSKTVSANNLVENGNSLSTLRTTDANVFSPGGFLSPAGNQINVINASAMTSVGTGAFAFGMWLTMPADTTKYHALFSASDNGGLQRPGGIICATRTDGGIRITFYKVGGTSADYWEILIGASQWEPGKRKFLWLSRSAAGVLKCGFNDQELSPAQGFGIGGTGVVDPAQSVTTQFVRFGGTLNNNGSDYSIHEVAFWDTEVDVKQWFLTGRPPGSPALWYRLREHGGTKAFDSSGNGRTGTLNGSTYWLCKSGGGALVTSNTTATITFNTSLQSETIYNTSASTIASSTITLPTASFDGQTLTYFTHGAHTAVTMAGGTVVGAALTSLSADQTVEWKASATSGTWIRTR